MKPHFLNDNAKRINQSLGYRAGGEAHTLRNTGDSTLKCIVVGQRLDHDVSDYVHLNKLRTPSCTAP